ncbi:hypothetical protein GCM10009830_03860 [Glycomyces endophyticus]|uniref:Uncharacterized protein n=1 Tax=Glycomyces endophyticus TaxID=480996 RepID=A0ABN2FZ51_9ACTN
MSRILSAAGTGGSFWSPSRGATSLSETRSGWCIADSVRRWTADPPMLSRAPECRDAPHRAVKGRTEQRHGRKNARRPQGGWAGS